MDSTNQDKPSSSVKLDGFAPASGSGAASSFMTGPTAAAASASASASAAGGISSASTSTTPSASSAGSIGTSTKKPPSASANAVATKTKQRTNAKKKLNKNNNNGGSATASSSAASSSETTTNNKNNNNNNDNDTEEATILRPLSEVDSSFTPLSLPQIQLRLRSLLEKLPRDLPAVLPPYDSDSSAEAIDVRHAPVKSFASALQIVVEEYNLLLSLVSCATYRWGVDRSGASQQNLSVMSAELQQCQEVISNVVSARLSNVLCPAVDVVVGEVEVVRSGKGGGDGDGDDNNNNNSGNGNNGEIATKKRKLNEDRLSNGDGGGGNGGDGANNERRINHYARPLVDPSYVHLCHRILARNAPLIRHTVATSLYTAQRVIGDYLKAMKKDSSHDSSKGGYY